MILLTVVFIVLMKFFNQSIAFLYSALSFVGLKAYELPEIKLKLNEQITLQLYFLQNDKA